MCATAANLIEDVLPGVALRQWVLRFPFPWRRRLALLTEPSSIARFLTALGEPTDVPGRSPNRGAQ
jgi:hypothetical protein